MRPTWDENFMKVAETISERSTCNRGKPGCVFVKNNQTLATGYAGSPPGFPHCDEIGHEMEERVRFIEVDENITEDEKKVLEKSGYQLVRNCGSSRYEKPPTQHCVRTIHAEQNAIYQAVRRGAALEGSTVYVTMTPCVNCTKALISVGVKRIVAKKLYKNAQESLDLLATTDIEIIHLENQIQGYETSDAKFIKNSEWDKMKEAERKYFILEYPDFYKELLTAASKNKIDLNALFFDSVENKKEPEDEIIVVIYRTCRGELRVEWSMKFKKIIDYRDLRAPSL